MKKKRHEAILKIIENNSVSTQTELLEMLNEQGFNTTQATISRDIKDLRLIKKADSFGRSCYAVDKTDNLEISSKYTSVFKHSVISSEYAGNMLVVKCHTGMANAACAALDVMNWDGIIGTLAGDDTIFILCRTTEIAEQIKTAIYKMIK